MTAMETLNKLRGEGWAVAIHNDYWLKGEHYTFYLLTHRSGIWCKGEGLTDNEALNKCAEEAEKWKDITFTSRGLRPAKHRLVEMFTDGELCVQIMLPRGKNSFTASFEASIKGIGYRVMQCSQLSDEEDVINLQVPRNRSLEDIQHDISVCVPEAMRLHLSMDVEMRIPDGALEAHS